MDKLQIIVIDSHGVSRAVCCALFRTEGVDVIADFGWRDGAITAALALAPDVVIVDVTPGHESHPHLRRLREVEEGPLIVLTSSVPHDDSLSSLRASTSSPRLTSAPHRSLTPWRKHGPKSPAERAPLPRSVGRLTTAGRGQ